MKKTERKIRVPQFGIEGGREKNGKYEKNIVGRIDGFTEMACPVVSKKAETSEKNRFWYPKDIAIGEPEKSETGEKRKVTVVVRGRKTVPH